jgi:thymidylate synthase (FAD)
VKIIKQSWEWMPGFEPNGEAILRLIESAGRLCYKSEDRITDSSHKEFVKRAISIGHHSIIEHATIPVRIITDRGVTHEIVRHRIASYSQESTRYCNYSNEKFGKEITVILPVWFENEHTMAIELYQHQYEEWKSGCEKAEKSYFNLLDMKQTPQEARAVLPNSLKTEIIMTCNVREWRHFFTLRASPKAHPQMRKLATSMLLGFSKAVPVIFDDIVDKVISDEMEKQK